MEFTLGDLSEIDQLCHMRMCYIEEDFGELSDSKRSQIMSVLPDYFQLHLGKDLYIFEAKEKGRIVATAMLIIMEKPANPNFLTGKVGEVLCVYTDPEYRGRGIASELMHMLIDLSKEKKLDYVELEATNDGLPIYQKLGFQVVKRKYTPMRLLIESGR